VAQRSDRRLRRERSNRGMPVIGWLSSLSPEGGKSNLAAFRKALADTEHVEGHNVQIEYRWANGL
jgi:hypothetical protein